MIAALPGPPLSERSLLDSFDGMQNERCKERLERVAGATGLEPLLLPAWQAFITAAWNLNLRSVLPAQSGLKNKDAFSSCLLTVTWPRGELNGRECGLRADWKVMSRVTQLL